MEIHDNGVGFKLKEKQQSTSSSSGVGLKSMMNRAKLIGADISITGPPEGGTTVIIELPLKED